jgi:hypothetical protein
VRYYIKQIHRYIVIVVLASSTGSQSECPSGLSGLQLYLITDVSIVILLQWLWLLLSLESYWHAVLLDAASEIVMEYINYNCVVY